MAVATGRRLHVPNMAGLATCLWQGFPELSNMTIRLALWQSASRANMPDDRTGYGIPDLEKAFVNLLQQFSSASGTISNCKATLNWTSKDVSAMRYEVERKIFGESNYSKIAVVAAQPNTSILAPILIKRKTTWSTFHREQLVTVSVKYWILRQQLSPGHILIR